VQSRRKAGSTKIRGSPYNDKARVLYHEHGVRLIDTVYEAHEEASEVSLMLTEHCARFSFNLCTKLAQGVRVCKVGGGPSR
jgi:predicted aldo/keto reductase-like oxidoreductase